MAKFRGGGNVMPPLQVHPGNPADDKCPSCGKPGILQSKMLTSAPYTSGMGIVVNPSQPLIRRTYWCSPCNIAWDTDEAAGGGQILTGAYVAPWTTHGNPVTMAPTTTIYAASATTGNYFLNSSAFLNYASPTPPPQGPTDESRGPLVTIPNRVIGYRAWNSLMSHDLLLRGTGGISQEAWKPGVTEAKCAYHQHPAPAYSCSCGLHALARFNPHNPWWREDNIVGAVAAWADETEDGTDRFFLHPDPGFRAQYMQIVLLATDDRFPPLKNELIRKILAPYYGADVCKREHLEQAAKEHGDLMPQELVDWAKKGVSAEADERLASQHDPRRFIVPDVYSRANRDQLREQVRKASPEALDRLLTEALKTYRGEKRGRFLPRKTR